MEREDLVTIDSILEYFTKCVEQRIPIGPHQWVEAALKMNVLLGGEHEKLYTLQQKVAQEKATLIANGHTAARAKAVVESLEVNKQANLQKAKIGRIEETVRLAKVMSRMASEEMRGSQ